MQREYCNAFFGLFSIKRILKAVSPYSGKRPIGGKGVRRTDRIRINIISVKLRNNAVEGFVVNIEQIVKPQFILYESNEFMESP